jgi:tyrosyl-tRNA synthetase
LEFIRKLHGQTPACCFSLNLLVKPDGTKFGKSESGAIYLDPTITSPYQMYQFLINQEDSMVEILLKRLTFFTKDEIEKILKTHQDNPALRFGQKQLAIAVTTDVHGARECEKAQKISQALFSGELAKLTNDELYVALTGTNVFDAELKEYPLIDLLVNAHVVPSKSEGRKLISQNSIYVNNQLITDFNQKISQRDGIGQKFSYLRKGKKQYFLIN